MSIKASLAKTFMKSKFWCSGHKSEITLVLGLAAMAGCVVATAIATKKSLEVLQDAKLDIEDINNDGMQEFVAAQNARRMREGLEPIQPETANMDPEIAKKQIKRKAMFKVVKNCAPVLVLASVSAVCQIKTYDWLKKDVIRISAAYVAAETGRRRLARYRNRALAKFGEEVDKELMYGEDGTDTLEVEKTTQIDPITGNEVEIYTPKQSERDCPWESIYSREYTNTSYQPGMDVEIVRCVQNWANDRLITKGYVLLNEVYEALKLPIDGRFVGIGWISPEYAKSGYLGDGYIDFGVFNNDLSRRTHNATAWQNNETNKVTLDFNVDGPIYQYINAINKLEEGNKDLWMADRVAYYRSKPQPHHV